LVEPPGRHKPDDAVDEGALVQDATGWTEIHAKRGDRRGAWRPRLRSKRGAEGVPGFTKLVPGKCRPMNSISIWLVLAVP
jgi:hypothetical protein